MFKVFNEKGGLIIETSHSAFALIAFNDHCAGQGGWVEDGRGAVIAGVKPRGSVDLTPTWSGVLPALLWGYKDGSETAQRLALEELTRMAKIADGAKK